MTAKRPALLLAGDVGGTKTNLALFTTADGVLRSVADAHFMNQGHAGLEDVVRAFLAGRADVPTAACFGVAGPVAEGRSRMPNLDWVIDARALARLLALDHVVLLNDLEATAHGVRVVDPEQVVVLNAGTPVATGNAALIAAGTGLGEAVLYWDGAGHRVSPSEGGHADFAPSDAEQIAILTRLTARFGHVSWERVVSGPGLHSVYGALDVPEPADILARIESSADPSATITELGLAGVSPRCVRALDVFVSAYGAEAGNLALRTIATGGVYVGGGIAPRILPRLTDGTFLRAFIAKGRFADWLARIPVKVILDPKTALRGAAAYLAGTETRA
jgi:glucokinase